MLKSLALPTTTLAPQAKHLSYLERYVAMPSSDQALVKQTLRGDAQTFAELVTRCTTPIFNLAFRLTGDGAEAENVAQDVPARLCCAAALVQ